MEALLAKPSSKGEYMPLHHQQKLAPKTLKIARIVSTLLIVLCLCSLGFIEGQWQRRQEAWNQLLKSGTRGTDGNYYPPSHHPSTNEANSRLKAAFVVLVRNNELIDMKNSMRHLESRFNHRYGYPWIFLNDEPFTDDFKEAVSRMTEAKTSFGLIPKEHWSYPEWISQKKAAEVRESNNYMYAKSEAYRHMCRYQSGFFFKHPLLSDLDYYWRVEPKVEFLCDINYDPFAFMALNNKTYGFTMAVSEIKETVPTLYQKTKEFFAEHPQYANNNSAMHFLTGKLDSKNIQQSEWNYCHFWSNFEIGDLRFWRSKAYLEYFDYLDKAGGFFYERWGDAPVHSIAASLMLDKSQIHFFEDIGYKHDRWDHCPSDQSFFNKGQCSCDPKNSYDGQFGSCIPQWYSDKAIKSPVTLIP